MRFTLLASAAFVALPLVANAQTAVFEDLDLDSNGSLSYAELQAEYPAFMESDMALIDVDENQMVDTGEYLNAVEGDVIDTVLGAEDGRGGESN